MVPSSTPAGVLQELEFEFDNVEMAPDATASTAQAAISRGAYFVVVYSTGAVVYFPDGQRINVAGSPEEPRALAAAIAERVGRRGYQPLLAPQVRPLPHQVPTSQPGVAVAHPIYRFDWRKWRADQRMSKRWRFRISLVSEATPRDCNGRGPLDGELANLTIVPGLGVRVLASYWVHKVIRLDVSANFVWAFELDIRDHGPEGAVGFAAMFANARRNRWGVGLGIEGIMAREVDTSVDGHFGWLGFRLLTPTAERAWMTRAGHGVVAQFGPTFTYVPYADSFFPGFFVSLGVDLAVFGSDPLEFEDED